MADRLDIPHDLPAELADALGDDIRTAGTLYNDLQDLSDAAFAERFESARDTLCGVVDVDAPLVVVVLGLSINADPSEESLVAGADIVSAHVPRGDGSIEQLLYTADESAATDTFVMLPVRPDDCPPGSGYSATTLSLSAFREVVSAMAYKRFDLLESDLDVYRDSYLRPTVRGLEAYAEHR